MSVLTRPGIYQNPVRPTRRVGGLARRDVPVFMGFATRGPAFEPIRIEALRQFSGIFGAPLAGTHLYDALKGFFETGGAAAYVLRVVGAGQQAAARRVGTSQGDWVIEARTRVADLVSLRRGETLQQWQDSLIRRHGTSLPDPGGWGNALSLRFTQQTGRPRAGEVSEGGLFISEMSDIAPGSLVELAQGPLRVAMRVAQVDPAARRVALRGDPLPEALRGPVTVALRQISVDVMLNGQRVEQFADLSPAPDHDRYFARVVSEQSAHLRLTGPDVVDPLAPDALPLGLFALDDGSDGLTSQTGEDWMRALEAQATIDEIALLSAPDLVRGGVEVADMPVPVAPAGDHCHLPIARPQGNVAGRLVDAQTGLGVPNARIMAAGEVAQTITAANGSFLLSGVSVGLLELRITADGYLPANPQVLSGADQTASDLDGPLEKLTQITLIRREDIPPLGRAEIDRVQRAMCRVNDVGAYRVAVLDPPAADLTPDALLGWVTSLDRSARAFAAGPWIGLPDPTGERMMMQPPSGHVCGAFAYAERAQGVHRAPGNVALRHVKSVLLPLSDALAAECHRAALNLISPTAGRGIRLMGARTLSADPAWRQVSVRRLFDALERTLASRLTWAVFEPNSATTRQILKFVIEQLLEGMRRRGMLAGDTPEASYDVAVDPDLNSRTAQARGELIAEVSVAPALPYEFITFTLSAQSDAIDVTEPA